MEPGSDNLSKWQRRYVIGGLAIALVAPLLFLQGRIARWKIGVLPEAAGPKNGVVGSGSDPANLLVIGESTVAGLGARTHDLALAGQFAQRLSEHLKRRIQWQVIGKNGVTARRVIDELLPHISAHDFDYILLGIGGNDVLTLSSPRKWREDMIELLSLLRGRFPNAIIFITNCPMVVMSTTIPEPSRSLLWQLSRLHDENIREFTRDLDRVCYYPQPVGVKLDGFFADGVHPSEQGYAEWAAAMVRYFIENCKW